MNFKTLGLHIKNPLIFKGSRKKPFLAPRGIHIHKTALYVADTGQNRVFIWNKLPTQEFQEPDVILGQLDSELSGRNAGGTVTANTLHYPSGLWSDGKKLIVADAWNHRVLIWNSMPTNNAQPADVVLGQPDFTSNQPNVKGIGSDPSAQSLNWPYGLFSDGTSLWIADTGNRRVLFYETIPDSAFAKADNVIGKSSFTNRDYDSQNPIWPYSVKVSDKGQLVVADTQFYRALLWHDKEDAFKKPADVIIGQTDFNACGQNRFQFTPEPGTLNWCYDACFYRDGLLVNDTGNSRILYFDSIPKHHGQEATNVIGRPDFKTGSEFRENKNGTEEALYWPFSMTISENRIGIADTGNHRIVLGELDFG